MSARPSVPPIKTSGLPSNVGGNRPPPPPPKSPLRATSRTGSTMSRRRGDGRVITLNMPTPLSALDPATPPAAEAVHMNIGGGGNRGSSRRDLPPPPTSPTSPGATLRAMRRQTQEMRERAQSQARYYPRPVSPLQLQSAKRTSTANGMRRESSFSRIGRRLSLTRQNSIVNLRNSFRKSMRKGGVLESGGSSNGGRRLSRGQSIVNMARRESVKLKSILKKPSSPDQTLPQAQSAQNQTQTQAQMQAQTSAPVPAPVPAPTPVSVPHPTASATKPSPGSTPGQGSGYALVAQKKVGATWHPPRRDVERRMSSSLKFRSILKPNPIASAAKRLSIQRKQPSYAEKDCPMKPSVVGGKNEKGLRRNSKRTSVGVDGNGKARGQEKKGGPSFEIVAPTPAPAKGPDSGIQRTQAQAQVQEKANPPVQSQSQTGPQTQDDRKFRDGKDILSEIDTKHLSGADARRLIRQHNREYFHSRIWDPALQSDFAGAYQLANGGSESAGSQAGPGAGTATAGGATQVLANLNGSQPQTQEEKHDSLQTLVGPTPPEKDKHWRSSAEKDDWTRRRDSLTDAEEWAQSVRLAMVRLEDKIQTEAKADPVRFMKARRESAQLRAWMAAQRRTSEARLSAIAMGRVQPVSPFEQAFVAELLRENEIKFKHSSNPMAEAQKLFKDLDTKRKKDSTGSSLLPHYVPFSQYPLLAPLEEIEADVDGDGDGDAKLSSSETSSDERNAGSTMYLPPRFRRRRLSEFDEKKAARRAGREYKSLSTATRLDELEMYETRCCGLWKPKAFVDKIS